MKLKKLLILHFKKVYFVYTTDDDDRSIMKMEIGQLLSQLNSDSDDSFQQTALEQAVLQKEVITPFLIDIIANYPKLNEAKSNSRAFVGALYLLAQFKEKAAYPIIVDFLIQKDGVKFLNPQCDLISEGLGRILASVCGGDLSLIKQIIENRGIDNDLRDAGLRSLVVLYNKGLLLREDLVAYFIYLIRNNLEEEKNPLFGASLLTYCFNIYPEELYDLIVMSYEKDVIDRDIINLDDIDFQMRVGKERVLEQLNMNHHGQFITDVVSELKDCGCFNERHA